MRVESLGRTVSAHLVAVGEEGRASVHAVVIVVLWVTTADARAPVTQAMLAAAREALAPDVDVRIEEHAVDAEPRAPADGEAVVAVEWSARGSIVTLRYRDADRAIERRVGFTASDAPGERGRTLGFVIASMLPELVARPPPPAEPTLAPPRVTGPPASTVSRPAPTTRRDRAARGRPRPGTRSSRIARVRVAPVAPGRVIARPPRVASSGAIEATGSLAIGLGDDDGTSTFGGSVAGLLWLVPRLALRLQIDARAGNIAEAQASTTWLAASAGADWEILETRGAVDLDVSLRATAGLARQSFTHFSDDDPAPDDEARWLGVAAAAVSGRLRLGPSIALLAVGGVELPFTTTDVYVRGQRRASVGAPRATAAVGIAAGF